MKRGWLVALLFGSAGLALSCTAGAALDGGDAAAVAEEARPTSTPIVLPTPTFTGTPRHRLRGLITRIDDETLTFRDIDGRELTLAAGPNLAFPWPELKSLHQQRARITVVYEQSPSGPVLVDVFPS